MLRRRPTTALVVPLALAAALLGLLAGPAAATTGPYVALGDSYTAAPLVPNQHGHPIGCARSDRNYPSIVRRALGLSPFRDASCSAATTAHMTERQNVPLGVHPPQLDALRPDATLVTVGIGANDAGLFNAFMFCARAGLLRPNGAACRSHYAQPDGGDRLADAIARTAPKIAATLRAIRSRSPRARVLIVGYPDVTPRAGRSCHPVVPLSADDLAYLDAMLRRTNAMLAEQAAASDVEYVDTYDESVGHDICTPPGVRWFEGFIPTAPAFPVHPNALGVASTARSVLRVLRQPRPAPSLGPLMRSQRAIRSGSRLGIRFTLSRRAIVTLRVRRSLGRGRYGAARRLRTVRAEAGRNAVRLSAERLGRRPGLYRIVAGVEGGRQQVVHVRIRRARR